MTKYKVFVPIYKDILNQDLYQVKDTITKKGRRMEESSCCSPVLEGSFRNDYIIETGSGGLYKRRDVSLCSITE